MALRFETIVVDAHDPMALATFWSALLGWVAAPADPGEAALQAPGGDTGPGTGPSELLFEPVPEGKILKNRIHLDLRPDDQAAEVARAEALGARRVSVGQGPDVTWVVLADPEGNEFCILRAKRPDET